MVVGNGHAAAGLRVVLTVGVDALGVLAAELTGDSLFFAVAFFAAGLRAVAGVDASEPAGATFGVPLFFAVEGVFFSAVVTDADVVAVFAVVPVAFFAAAFFAGTAFFAAAVVADAVFAPTVFAAAFLAGGLFTATFFAATFFAAAFVDAAGCFAVLAFFAVDGFAPVCVPVVFAVADFVPVDFVAVVVAAFVVTALVVAAFVVGFVAAAFVGALFVDALFVDAAFDPAFVAEVALFTAAVLLPVPAFFAADGAALFVVAGFFLAVAIVSSFSFRMRVEAAPFVKNPPADHASTRGTPASYSSAHAYPLVCANECGRAHVTLQSDVRPKCDQ